MTDLLLSFNQLTSLPAEIAGLPCLEALAAFENPLEDVPYEIGRIKSLKYLSLSKAICDNWKHKNGGPVGEETRAVLLAKAYGGKKNLDPSISSFKLDLKFNPNVTSNVHEALGSAFGDDWNTPLYQNLERAVKRHLQISPVVRDTMATYGLTKDEIGSLVYYSADARQFGGKREDSIYSVLNNTLVNRRMDSINEKWVDLISLLFSAREKLPKVSGTFYRGIDTRLGDKSTQYERGNNIVWVGFTSMTKNKEVIKDFSSHEAGTWMVINIKAGIELPFSLFPSEEEVLIFPNFVFQVKEKLTPGLKSLASYPDNLEVLELEEI